MQVRIESEPNDADVLVVPVREGGEAPAAAPARVRELLESGEATGEFAQATLVHVDGGPKRIAVAGLGKRADAHAVASAVGAAARAAKRIGGTVAYLVDDSLPLSGAEQARAAVDGLVLAAYDPAQWRSNSRNDAKPFEQLVLVGADEAAVEAA